MPFQPPTVSSLNTPQNAQLLRSLERAYRAPSAVRPTGMPNLPVGTSFRQAIRRPGFVLRVLGFLAAIGISVPIGRPSGPEPPIDIDITNIPTLGVQLGDLPPNTKFAAMFQSYSPKTNTYYEFRLNANSGWYTLNTPLVSVTTGLMHPTQPGWVTYGTYSVTAPNNEEWKPFAEVKGSGNTAESSGIKPFLGNWLKVKHFLYNNNQIALTGKGNPIPTPVNRFVPVLVPVPVGRPTAPIPEPLPVEPAPTPPTTPKREIPVVNPPIPINPIRPESPSWDDPDRVIIPGTIIYPQTPSTPTAPFPTSPTPSIPIPVKKPLPSLPSVHPQVPRPDIVTPIAPQPVPVPTQPPSSSMPPIPNMPAPPDPPGAIVPSPPGQLVPSQKPGPITNPSQGNDSIEPCQSDPCAMAMMGAITLQLTNIGKVMASIEALETYLDGNQGQDIAWIKAKLGRRSDLTVEDMADLNTKNLALANANNIYGIAAAIQAATSLSKSSAIEIANTYNQLATVLNLDFREVTGNVTETQLDNNAVAERNIKQVDAADNEGNLPDESSKNNRLGILASNIYHDSVMNWASTNKALEKILEILSTTNNVYYRTGRIPQNQSTLLPTTYKIKTPLIDGLDGLEDNEYQDPVVKEFSSESINELKTKQHTVDALTTFNTEYREDSEAQITKLNEEYEADKQFSDAPNIDETDHYPPIGTI